MRWRGQDFHNLMRHRIMDVLLVSRPYDSFILEEAGQLSERMFGEFRNLDLHYTPGLTTVASGGEALALAREQSRFNLVIGALQLSDMDGAELARRFRAEGLAVPVVLLAFDNRDLKDFQARHDLSAAERVFLWQGDARILLAIVKYVEDKANVAHDTESVGVQVMILIEDNVRYYSSFLPEIYSELLSHSQRLVREGVNLSHKIMRMRARPKILLCGTFEEAWQAFNRYQEDVLGVVSDVEFPKGGAWNPEAGLDFARLVKQSWPDVPVLLQSSRPENEREARAVGADFLQKGSPLLLHELRRFMLDNFGFGDFVFKTPEGQEVGRANDLRSLEATLGSVAASSIAYHAERNHFSKWLKARTEFELAHELRPRKLADFADVEELRGSLIGSVHGYRMARSHAAVADFDREGFDLAGDFHRIGGGSLGGKARGLVFVRRLLGESRIADEFPGIGISVPTSLVLASDVFDAFLDKGGLRDFAISEGDDASIRERFLAAPFPEEPRADLRALLERVSYPLAVRSSSLLEDSAYQPFSGVYETHMLRNNHPFLETRLQDLLRAVKLVYASTFLRRAKDYIRATPFRLEEEKMAVIVQRVVGAAHGARFYPDFAGVARSHNFYPAAPLSAADGIAAVALGLGRTVVEGGSCLRFSPRLPQHLIQLSSAAEALRSTQRSFWALALDRDETGEREETRFELEAARSDGTLRHLGSTYSAENDAIYDGVGRPGSPIVSFAGVLKHDAFPLPRLLRRLLEVASWGLGSAVEIEFAVTLPAAGNGQAEFGFLQLRPLALSRETEALEIRSVDESRVLCRSAAVLGNGRIDDVRHLVVVDPARFERGKSHEVAQALSEINAELLNDGHAYLLIGAGRWGSADPWLGIPVTWEQISAARVIVEAGLRDFHVTPSQGTHFFHNLTCFNVGYFTVNPDAGEGFVDWDWLAAQPAERERSCVRLLAFEKPVVALLNGKKSEGLILKP
jgi:CheY-like chemotaxis protein